MNIYEPEGVDAIVDLRKAAAELRGVSSVTSDVVRRQIIAEISTAALLDIALSLRVVAAEARAAMPSPFMDAEPEAAPTEDDRDRDFLIVGDLVAADGMDEPGEVRGFGQSEGAMYADVIFAGGAESRVWLSNLTRLVGDERDDDAMQEAAESSIEIVNAERVAEMAGITAEPEEHVEPADLVDDIDGDFEGDTHTAAATALDVLKASEAARKGGKKKGKKS